MDTATGKLVASEEESGDVDNSESEIWFYQGGRVTEKPIAHKTARGKPHASGTSVNQEGPKAGRKTCHIQPHSTIRKQFSRSSGGSTDENMTTYG